MIRPSGSKAAHVTCICPALGALHDFDMQSSGGSAGALALLLTHGVLMSFLDALRSLAEQVAMGVRLIIGGVSTLVDKSR
jgi:chromosome condensin MukBEF ATPase and DNA-binding subunit MukB